MSLSLFAIAFAHVLASSACGGGGAGGNGGGGTKSTATITVSGTQWGLSTQYIGANEGDQNFNINDLKDLGINTYRIYGGMQRWEAQDDDGVPGAPTIAQIQADPNVINWAWWDNIMTTPPSGSDYWWSSGSAAWQGNARTMFQALKDNGIRPVVVLRNVAPGGNPVWANSQLNPPNTPDEQNEWWEHVFATVYWLNVRNDYKVDDWEIHNEPDNPSQGWAGTQADYLAFAALTSDAIRYVYSAYLPGRTPHIYAPGTVTGSAWPLTLMQQAVANFDSVDIHDYDNNVDTYVEQVHGWMNANGIGNASLWMSEWGTFTAGTYSSVNFGVNNIVTNLIRGSQPGDSRVDGSHIFSLYDWGNGSYGLIGPADAPRAGYYAMRLAVRGLQGGRETYETTSTNTGLLAITTKDSAGHYWVIIANTSPVTLSATLDISALLTTSSGTMWQFDATHNDVVVGSPSLTGGRVVLTLTGNGAFLFKL